MPEQKTVSLPVGPHHEAIGELYMSNKIAQTRIQELEKMLTALENENKQLKDIEQPEKVET